jgi:hypothetical protein
VCAATDTRLRIPCLLGAGGGTSWPDTALGASRIRPAVTGGSLAAYGTRFHRPGMFVVSEAEAAAIRAAFDSGGEFLAAVELRRLFPGVTDNAQALECARTIAAWKPLPLKTRLARLPSKGR